MATALRENRHFFALAVKYPVSFELNFLFTSCSQLTSAARVCLLRREDFRLTMGRSTQRMEKHSKEEEEEKTAGKKIEESDSCPKFIAKTNMFRRGRLTSL